MICVNVRINPKHQNNQTPHERPPLSQDPSVNYYFLNCSSDDEETDTTARDKTPKSAVKKRVLRPEPKLDAER